MLSSNHITFVYPLPKKNNEVRNLIINEVQIGGVHMVRHALPSPRYRRRRFNRTSDSHLLHRRIRWLCHLVDPLQFHFHFLFHLSFDLTIPLASSPCSNTFFIFYLTPEHAARKTNINSSTCTNTFFIFLLIIIFKTLVKKF